MLFQVVHTHSHETCPGVFPDRLKTFSEWWAAIKANPNVKVLGGYVSPMDHVFHITLEADDFATVSRAVGPLNSIGSGRVSPVLTLDQAMPLAESGAFRA
jgi:Domain of unknown function (DUF3303)